MRDAFAAKSMDCRVASDQRLLFGWPSPDVGGVGVWYATRSGRPPGTAPYRMPYSCSAPYVSRNYVDTTVPQLIADLCSGLPIKMSVELIAMATVDGRRMMGDLFVAFARIGRAQFVEAFEVVLMEDVPCRANNPLLEIEVAFVQCQQVAATVGRDLFGKPQRVTDVIIHSDPARCRRA